MKKPQAIVTAGPTREKIDPVRFISNYSSGKQGYAVAEALLAQGYLVTLISGPVNIPPPDNVKLINIQSAEEMLNACIQALPADVAVFTAAVCDFRPASVSAQKIKKKSGILETRLRLVENQDILKTISHHKLRPKIVVGFAAETENLIENATHKLNTKGCDVIVANNVSEGSVFGMDITSVSIITQKVIEEYSHSTKDSVAAILVNIISNMLENKNI